MFTKTFMASRTNGMRSHSNGWAAFITPARSASSDLNLLDAAGPKSNNVFFHCFILEIVKIWKTSKNQSFVGAHVYHQDCDGILWNPLIIYMVLDRVNHSRFYKTKLLNVTTPTFTLHRLWRDSAGSSHIFPSAIYGGWLVFYVFLNIFRILVKQIWRQPSGFNNLWRDSTESSHTPPPEFGHSQVVSTMCDALSLQWVQICIPETRTVLVMMIKLVSPPPSATQGQIHRGALSWTIPRVCPRHHLEIQPGASAPDTRRDSSCRTGACDLLQKAGSSSEARLRDVEGCKNLAICKSVFFTVKPMLTILVWQWVLISVMNSQTEEHWIISWILPKISVIYTGSLISTPWKPTFAKTGPWFSWMSLAGPFAWSPVGKPTVWILCAYIFNTMDQYRSDEPDLNTGFLDRMLV